MTALKSKNDQVSASKSFAAAPEDRQQFHRRAVEHADKNGMSYLDAVVALLNPNQDPPEATALKAHRGAPDDRQKLNAQILDYAQKHGVSYREAARAVADDIAAVNAIGRGG